MLFINGNYRIMGRREGFFYSVNVQGRMAAPENETRRIADTVRSYGMAVVSR